MNSLNPASNISKICDDQDVVMLDVSSNQDVVILDVSNDAFPIPIAGLIY